MSRICSALSHRAHQEMARLPEVESNKLSVRTELQADYYAGVWAYHDNRLFNSLEPGDIEEGLNAASKIGDDYLQKQAQGYAVPETFNHGRSDQRVRWLNSVPARATYHAAIPSHPRIHRSEETSASCGCKFHNL